MKCYSCCGHVTMKLTHDSYCGFESNGVAAEGTMPLVTRAGDWVTSRKRELVSRVQIPRLCELILLSNPKVDDLNCRALTAICHHASRHLFRILFWKELPLHAMWVSDSRYIDFSGNNIFGKFFCAKTTLIGCRKLFETKLKPHRPLKQSSLILKDTLPHTLASNIGIDSNKK